MDEPITVTTHTSADGSQTFTVERWPRDVVFDDYLLKTANTDVLRVDGDEVTITVENGKAVYQLRYADIDPRYLAIPASLVSSRLAARQQQAEATEVE